jgi:CheY-like chemotaxis protein
MILIVDDEPGVSLAFGRVLNQVGVTYDVADSCGGARAALKRGPWTAFILDIFLTDGTGVDLLREIRQLPRHFNTPCAVITADILLEDGLVARIEAARARLRCGAFDRSAVEAICLDLLLTNKTLYARSRGKTWTFLFAGVCQHRSAPDPVHRSERGPPNPTAPQKNGRGRCPLRARGVCRCS